MLWCLVCLVRAIRFVPEPQRRFFGYAVSKDLARHEAETPPGTAGVSRRRSRHLAGAGRAGYRPIVARTGDCCLERISTTPLALSVTVADVLPSPHRHRLGSI